MIITDSSHSKKTDHACIVAPGLMGPITNGGIGAHCYYFAKMLAEYSFDVTIVLTSSVERLEESYWIEYYAKLGMTLVIIDKDAYDLGDAAINRSYSVYRYLTQQNFDSIHFQEWRANGYVSLQAKRAGIAFENTVLSVATLSSAQWIREGMKLLTHHGKFDLRLDIYERFCIENADILAVPTDHMHQWLLDHELTLPADVRSTPYICEPLDSEFQPYEPDTGHLCFYGRLETRKGLEIFVEALIQYLDGPECDLHTVSFLGKSALVEGGENALNYLYRRLDSYANRINILIHTTFSADEAVHYLRDSCAIAVIPSLMDNLPYAILDCIVNRQCFITSDIGGISEVVASELLFTTDVDSLLAMFRKLRDIDFSEVRHHYNVQEAKKVWRDLSLNVSKQTEHCDSNFDSIAMLPISSWGELIPSDYILVSDLDVTVDAKAAEAIAKIRGRCKKNSYLFYHSTKEDERKITPSLGWVPVLFELEEQPNTHAILLDADIYRKFSKKHFDSVAQILNGLDPRDIIAVPELLYYESNVVQRNPYEAYQEVLRHLDTPAYKRFAIDNILLPHYMLMRHLDLSLFTQRKRTLLARLDQCSYDSIAIYGFNNFGKEIYRMLMFMGYPVGAILDMNADKIEESGGFVLKKPSPETISQYHCFILATDRHHKSMRSTLIEAGAHEYQIVSY